MAVRPDSRWRQEVTGSAMHACAIGLVCAAVIAWCSTCEGSSCVLVTASVCIRMLVPGLSCPCAYTKESTRSLDSLFHDSMSQVESDV